MKEIKNKIINYLNTYYLGKYQKHIEVVVEEPKQEHLGDLSIPLFQIANKLNQSIPECYEEMESIISLLSEVKDIKRMGGFVNINLSRLVFVKNCMEKIANEQSHYGNNKIGLGKTMVIDFSSPNIAKPFSVGHLRSTIIGHALANLYEKCGYKVIRVNHLGDFGTQFGKLIVAYKKWSQKESIMSLSMDDLLELYVKFHDEANKNPQLNQEARLAFLKLEQGYNEYVDLWKAFKEISLKEFKKMYDLLGVHFDYYDGESFYNDKMNAVIEELEEKNLLVEDQGAIIVKLEGNIPPALIKKSDGATLYITRDLAAVFYRMKMYHFDHALYVVGNEQTLHFNQLKQVIHKLGYNYAEDLAHVNFGLVLQDRRRVDLKSRIDIDEINGIIK